MREINKNNFYSNFFSRSQDRFVFTRDPELSGNMSLYDRFLLTGKVTCEFDIYLYKVYFNQIKEMVPLL